MIGGPPPAPSSADSFAGDYRIGDAIAWGATALLLLGTAVLVLISRRTADRSIG